MSRARSNKRDSQASVTIDSVSRAAGVSKATVSRVLNNPEKVKEETRTRVLEVIRRSHFEPSSVARSLARQRTSTIGVVLEDISNPFFMELAKGVESVLSAKGYTMVITSSGWIQEREVEIVRLLIRQRVDGVLIAPITSETGAVRMLRDARVPFVLMNCRASERDFSWVTTDNVLGGFLATRHAIDLGYDRVVCLHGFKHQTTEERVRGYRKAMAQSEGRVERIEIKGARTESEGSAIVPELIRRLELHTRDAAIFALNDFVAMAVIDGFLDAGIDVPGRVSVIGFDDIHFAGRFRVPLTTVAQAKYKMGEIAATELLRRIETDGKPETFLLSPELIVRKSTRPAQIPPEAAKPVAETIHA